MLSILTGFSRRGKVAFGQKDIVDEIGRCEEGKNVWKGMGSNLIPVRHGCNVCYKGGIEEQWVTGYKPIDEPMGTPSHS